MLDGLRAERRQRTAADLSCCYLWGMSAPDATTDPELEAVAWDLDPLLDGGADDPEAAVDAMLADAQRRADAFAAAHAGKVAELDGPGLVAAMRELGRDRRSSPAAPAPTRS